METGVGPQNADRAIRKIAVERQIGGLIHIGFAGALAPSLHLGDLVLLESVENAEGSQSIATGSAKRIASAIPDESPWHFGVCLTFDHIIATAGEKHAIAKGRPEGEITCVDMESAPVAAFCREQGLPYIGIRAITDTLDEDLPLNLNECRGRDGNIDTMRVMWAAVHHPSAISGLVELRRRSKDCAQALATCVKRILSQYPTPGLYSGTLP